MPAILNYRHSILFHFHSSAVEERKAIISIRFKLTAEESNTTRGLTKLIGVTEQINFDNDMQLSTNTCVHNTSTKFSKQTRSQNVLLYLISWNKFTSQSN
jgi:hypothetical protein